jgi:hypothetical protein
MSERGQRASFNGADGISDMAGEAARVAVEPSGSERDTMLLAGLQLPDEAIKELNHAALRQSNSRVHY